MDDDDVDEGSPAKSGPGVEETHRTDITRRITLNVRKARLRACDLVSHNNAAAASLEGLQWSEKKITQTPSPRLPQRATSTLTVVA